MKTKTMFAKNSLECGTEEMAWAFLAKLDAETRDRVKARIPVMVRLSIPLAEDFLAGMRLNRALSMPLVRQLVRDIDVGKWDSAGGGIKVDPDGRMWDGQHTCQARLRSKQDIEVLLRVLPYSENVGEETSHRTRTLLEKRGIENARKLASLGTMLWLDAQGHPPIPKIGVDFRPDRVECADAIAENLARIRKSVEIVWGLRLPWGIFKKHLAFLHYKLSKYNRTKADRFVMALADPEKEKPDSIYRINVEMLRAHLKREELRPKSFRARPAPPVARYAWLVQCWNDTENGRECGVFSWGVKREPPSIRAPEK